VHQPLRFVRLAGVDDIRVRRRARELILALHEQPLLPLAEHARAHEVPFAA
jgi:hypothetical protein